MPSAQWGSSKTSSIFQEPYGAWPFAYAGAKTAPLPSALPASRQCPAVTIRFLPRLRTTVAVQKWSPCTLPSNRAPVKAAEVPGLGVPEVVSCGCFPDCGREVELAVGFAAGPAGAAAWTRVPDGLPASGTT